MTAQASPPAPSPGGGMLFFCGLLIAAAAVGLTMLGRAERQSAPEDVKILAAVPGSVRSIHESNAAGLHNVFRLGDTIFSGSSPDDDSAFTSLTRLGIKTIVSVDGAAPDLEGARAHGMRYVHIPITYSSVPHEALIGLVRASQELPGPIYVHCHHGKHRGPAAAVSLWRCLDHRITTEQAVATLKLIGTDDRYQGLYESVRDQHCPTAAEVKGAKAELPELSHVPPLAKTMADIDRMWDRVAVPVVARNSTTLSLQLTTAYDIAELFREAARLGDVPDEMQPEFTEIEKDLEKLAAVIKDEVRQPSEVNMRRADAVAQVKAHCDRCHAKFRD